MRTFLECRSHSRRLVMLRSDLDPAPALTTARGTGVGFAVAMRPVATHTMPPNDDEAAARDGWQRCLDWMRANGVA